MSDFRSKRFRWPSTVHYWMAGLDFALSDRMTAGMSYTGQYSDSVTDNGVKGRFTWLF